MIYIRYDKILFFLPRSGRDQVEPQTPCGDGYACEDGEFCDEYWDGPNSGEEMVMLVRMENSVMNIGMVPIQVRRWLCL